MSASSSIGGSKGAGCGGVIIFTRFVTAGLLIVSSRRPSPRERVKDPAGSRVVSPAAAAAPWRGADARRLEASGERISPPPLPYRHAQLRSANRSIVKAHRGKTSISRVRALHLCVRKCVSVQRRAEFSLFSFLAERERFVDIDKHMSKSS